MGTLHVERGSWVGTGRVGSSNPNSITFTGKPILVYVRDATTTYSNEWRLLQVEHLTSAFDTQMHTTFYGQNYAKYENHVLSWYTYNTGSTSDQAQLNASGRTYEWFAICE